MSPLIMKMPNRDKTLTRKPNSRAELLFKVFGFPLVVDVGADEDVDEIDEESWEFVDDTDMILSTSRPERGGHSQGQRMHK